MLELEKGVKELEQGLEQKKKTQQQPQQQEKEQQVKQKVLTPQEMDAEYQKSEVILKDSKMASAAKKKKNWSLVKDIVTPLAKMGHAKSQFTLAQRLEIKDHNQKNFYIPMNEQNLVNVNILKKIITINPIPGLID